MYFRKIIYHSKKYEKEHIFIFEEENRKMKMKSNIV